MRSRTIDWVLVVITATAAIIGAIAVGRVRNWAVMTDELLYTGMARAIAGSWLPLPRLNGEPMAIKQVLFPAIIAPLVGGFSMPTAYPLIAALNAAIFATAAIPAYLLTKLVTDNRSAARWVALCTVIVPWLSFASKALPDSLAYVGVLWCAFVMARTIRPSDESPPLKGDLLVLLAIVLTYLIRNQFMLLAGVWVGSVVLARIAETLAGGRATALPKSLLLLLKQRPIPLITFFVLLAVLKFQPAWLLGVYSITTTSYGGGAAPPGTLSVIAKHISVIGLGAAGIPLVLGLPWLLTALTRVKTPTENNAAIVILLLSGAILFVGATFNLRFTEYERVIERYVFYFAPLMFVAMAGTLLRPPRNPLAFAIPALIGLLLLGASRPYGLDTNLTTVINHAFSPVQIVLVPYQRVADAIGTSIFALTFVLVVVSAAVAWWLIARERNGVALNVIFGVTAAITLLGTVYSLPKIVDTQNTLVDNVYDARTAAQKTWVDSATSSSDVALAYSPRRDPSDPRQIRPAERVSNWWDLAFWNGAINTVYTPTRVLPNRISPFPGESSSMLPDWTSGKLTRSESDDSEYLLQAESDPRFQPQFTGEPVSRSGFVLRHTGHNMYAAWATKGLSFAGWIPPAGATLRVWAPRRASQPATLTIQLAVDGPLKPAGKVTVDGASAVKTVRLGRRTLYSWDTTIEPGGHSDFELTRSAPAHVVAIRVSAPRGSASTPR